MMSNFLSPRSTFVTRIREGSPGSEEGCAFNSQGVKWDMLREVQLLLSTEIGLVVKQKALRIDTR